MYNVRGVSKDEKITRYGSQDEGCKMGIARWGSQARRIRKDGECKTGIDRKMNKVRHKFKDF